VARKVGDAMVVAGKYRLLDPIGAGGMAVVYRAEMKSLGRRKQVALKKMKAELHAAENYVAMFQEEARVGGELKHPNIVQVFDLVQDDDGHYCLVMEWVDGTDLRGLLAAARQRGRLMAWPVIAAVGVGALRGLAAAHDRTKRGKPSPVIHRDVSPSNILLGRTGVVKLADFGLARARDRMHSLTAPGIIKGKLAYIAPEITQGAHASTQSDIFSMGCVLWEALAGRALYDGQNDLEVFRKVQSAEVRPLKTVRNDIPAELAAVIHKALAVDLGERYQSARQMGDELAAVLAQQARTRINPQTLLAHAVREALGGPPIPPPPPTDKDSGVIELTEGDVEPR
jgi:serine/threonine protein kinase